MFTFLYHLTSFFFNSPCRPTWVTFHETLASLCKDVYIFPFYNVTLPHPLYRQNYSSTPGIQPWSIYTYFYPADAITLSPASQLHYGILHSLITHSLWQHRLSMAQCTFLHISPTSSHIPSPGVSHWGCLLLHLLSSFSTHGLSSDSLHLIHLHPHLFLPVPPYICPYSQTRGLGYILCHATTSHTVPVLKINTTISHYFRLICKNSTFAPL